MAAQQVRRPAGEREPKEYREVVRTQGRNAKSAKREQEDGDPIQMFTECQRIPSREKDVCVEKRQRPVECGVPITVKNTCVVVRVVRDGYGAIDRGRQR